MVKRAMNRAPSERDQWWADHQRTCGGTYSKVKEPDDYGNKKRKISDETRNSKSKNNSPGFQMPKIYDLWRKENSADTNLLIKEKENNTQNSNTESASAVIPFAGKGFVLGSCKDENSTDTGPRSSNGRKSLFRNEKVEKNIGGVKTVKSSVNSNVIPSKSTFLNAGKLGLLNDLDENSKTGKQKKNRDKKVKKKNNLDNNGELTIIDAFKTVGMTKKKAPIVIDVSPVKPEVLSSVVHLVSCPVCHVDVQKNHINSHLDNCLS